MLRAGFCLGLRVREDSYAHWYAVRYGIPFILY